MSCGYAKPEATERTARPPFVGVYGHHQAGIAGVESKVIADIVEARPGRVESDDQLQLRGAEVGANKASNMRPKTVSHQDIVVGCLSIKTHQLAKKAGHHQGHNLGVGNGVEVVARLGRPTPVHREHIEGIAMMLEDEVFEILSDYIIKIADYIILKP